MADDFSKWLFTKRNDALRLYNDFPIPQFAESPTQTSYTDRTVLLETHEETRISITQVVSEHGIGSFCKILNVPHHARVFQLKDLRDPNYAAYLPQITGTLFSLIDPGESRLSAEHLAFLDDAMIMVTPDDFSGTVNLGFLLKEVKHLHFLLLIGKRNHVAMTIDVRSETSEATYGEEIFVGEDSALQLIVRESATAGNLYSVKRHKLEAGTNVHAIIASKATRTLITKTQTIINGKESTNKTYAVFTAQNQGVIEQESNALHLSPSSQADTNTRGIASDESACLVRGTIHITEPATQTRSNYEGKVMVLGAKAKANVLPTLKIFTNDVQAKHGAGVGNFGDEDIFYLESRGLSKDEAKKMLVEGFFHPLIGEFPKQDQEGLYHFFRI